MVVQFPSRRTAAAHRLQARQVRHEINSIVLALYIMAVLIVAIIAYCEFIL